MSSASVPMRLCRPDFRKILRNLSDYQRELGALTMDDIYETITKIVDDKSLNETDTERLVEKYMVGVAQPQECFEAIMRAIWPPPQKTYIIVFNTKVTDLVSTSKDKLEHLVEDVEHALGIKTTHRAVFQVIDSNSTIVMDDGHLIIEKEGRAIPLRGKICGELSNADSGGSYHAKQDSTSANPSNALINANIANDATQTPLSGGPSTSDPPDSVPGSSHGLQPPSSGSIDSHSGSDDDEAPSQHFQPAGTGHHPVFGSLLGGAPRGQTALRGRGRGGPRGRGSAFTQNPAASHRSINYYPPSGRELKRTYAMTELSPPGAQTIILGPLPPTLPPGTRISTLPPGHPPQSYGPGAIPPFYNIPGTSSGNSGSGTTSGITQEAASASSTQPVVSAQSPDSSESSKKRSRDDQDDEEDRPFSRSRIGAPPQSPPPDDTTTYTAPVAFVPTNDVKSSSDNGSHKKRTRDAVEEDEEEISRASTRMRQSPPAVRPRYPSPTPSDRRIGRIIAPFGRSIRFNPRPSPEADIGTLGAARNEGNPPDNLQVSSSGSQTLPLASSESTSTSRSSQRIREKKAKEVAE
ncbi:hypothetical protein BYT27DRAFT_7259559 [Phlegmacium glaucopus]|nr:hypothetical protein BYT27DRAFT_7259559 [Phlegmacium glaucopus]